MWILGRPLPPVRAPEQVGSSCPLWPGQPSRRGRNDGGYKGFIRRNRSCRLAQAIHPQLERMPGTDRVECFYDVKGGSEVVDFFGKKNCSFSTTTGLRRSVAILPLKNGGSRCTRRSGRTEESTQRRIATNGTTTTWSPWRARPFRRS